MKRTRIVVLVALALTLAACDSGPSPTPSPTSSLGSRPSSSAKISIVSPTAGQIVSTKGVIVKVSLEGATLSKQASTNLRPDQGHIHLLVDDRTITLLGSLEVETGPLTAGTHLIQVEFAANDHGPFNPRVLAQVSVRAE